MSLQFSCRQVLIFNPAVFKDHHEPQLLNQFFESTKDGVFVDIGGNEPSNSVSKQFWDRGWRGFIVEPLPQNAELFRAIPGITIEECALTSKSKVADRQAVFTVAGQQSTLDRSKINDKSVIDTEIVVSLATLDELLTKHAIDHIDLLSIDTEGTEIDVLEGFNFSNTTVQLILIEDWGRDFSLHRYLTSKGYKRVRRTGFNSWYVPIATPFPISFFGHLQMFRKFVLGMPGRRYKKWQNERRET